MMKLFNIEKIENDTVHFSLANKKLQSYDVILYDKNSGLPIHVVKDWVLGDGWFFVGPGWMKQYVRTVILEISDKHGNIETAEVDINSGANRIPTVNGKKFTFAYCDKRTAFYPLCEIFYDHDYDKDLVTPQPGDVIVDIGANLGMFSVYAQNFYPSRVLAFEPSDELFEKLSKNTELFSNIEVYRYAVSDTSYSSKLIISEDTLGSHLEKNARDTDSDESSSEIVNCIGINELIMDLGLSRIDFLKVDCEGSEIDIFRAIDKEYLMNHIRKVALEYHTSEIKNELLSIFANNGFILQNTEALSDASSYGLLYYYNEKNF